MIYNNLAFFGVLLGDKDRKKIVYEWKKQEFLGRLSSCLLPCHFGKTTPLAKDLIVMAAK